MRNYPLEIPGRAQAIRKQGVLKQAEDKAVVASATEKPIQNAAQFVENMLRLAPLAMRTFAKVLQSAKTDRARLEAFKAWVYACFELPAKVQLDKATSNRLNVLSLSDLVRISRSRDPNEIAEIIEQGAAVLPGFSLRGGGINSGAEAESGRESRSSARVEENIGLLSFSPGELVMEGISAEEKGGGYRNCKRCGRKFQALSFATKVCWGCKDKGGG